MIVCRGSKNDLVMHVGGTVGAKQPYLIHHQRIQSHTATKANLTGIPVTCMQGRMG